MILPDVNVLLYAYDRSSPHHDTARDWWEAALSGREPIGLAWSTVLGFIRISTHPRVFSNPMAIDESASHVDAWFGQPVAEVITPGPRHWAILSRLLLSTRSGANLTTDAHLAAMAIEYGACVFSSDTDFHRFPGLRLQNPLRA